MPNHPKHPGPATVDHSLAAFLPDAALLAGIPDPDPLRLAGVIADADDGDAAAGSTGSPRQGAPVRCLAEFIQEKPDP